MVGKFFGFGRVVLVWDRDGGVANTCGRRWLKLDIYSTVRRCVNGGVVGPKSILSHAIVSSFDGDLRGAAKRYNSSPQQSFFAFFETPPPAHTYIHTYILLFYTNLPECTFSEN